MQLAAHFKRPDVDRFLGGITYRQYLDWLAYQLIDPFGDVRADWRIAKVAALIAELKRDRTRRFNPYEPKEFVLKFVDPQKPQQQRTQSSKEQWSNWLLILKDHALMQKQAKKKKRGG